MIRNLGPATAPRHAAADFLLSPTPAVKCSQPGEKSLIIATPQPKKTLQFPPESRNTRRK
ncbi:MAG: hypothetical protein IT425_04100 [Pirellulales bacterium]|nr:hypothetical protein [Pirellulales bacterium]